MEEQVMDAEAMRRALTRIGYEIIERHRGTEDLVLAGIVHRGTDLAKRLAMQLSQLSGHEITVVDVDPHPYRDDVAASELPDISVSSVLMKRRVVLVDDVLYTGRTVRAAMDALRLFGRPASIELAVLVDRGHRELPIRPDFVGKNLTSRRDQRVVVRLREIDGVDQVMLKD